MAELTVQKSACQIGLKGVTQTVNIPDAGTVNKRQFP